jgi:demethylmenaquinone methyltransferase/2-methoxy-6-polyprenyl-1,4-benzoquinol methylase
VSGHRTAYRYLPRSVANFPVEEELARRMERAGFARVRWESLTLGVAAIHVGEAGASSSPKVDEKRPQTGMTR